MLYQPIVGYKAISLYLTLYSEFKKQDVTSISTHQELIDLMGININDVQEARRYLEGIGLLQTYFKNENNQSTYKYLLFAPKSPSDFFNDILLKGLLVRAIGQKKVSQIANIYKSKYMDLSDFVEISESFTNAFHPDLDSNEFSSIFEFDNSYTKKIKDVSKDFDKGLFLTTLENNYQIKQEAISEQELDNIAKIALLYGVEEEIMSDFVSQSLIDGKINFEMVRKQSLRDKSFAPIKNTNVKSKDIYDGQSDLSKKIKLMSSISAFDYLKIKQNNSAISPSDLKIIDELSNNYNLSSRVINPLIDYVLENYDNTLPKNLIFKIAGSLTRNQIDSTIDAMNYLYKIKNSKIQTKESKETAKNSNDDELAKLLDEIGDN